MICDKIGCFEQYFENCMAHILDSLSGYGGKAIKIGAGVSGGSDSMALALLLNSYCKRNNASLNIYIVDHALRKESRKEAESTKETLSKLGLVVKILSWNHNDIPFGKIENMARQARYRLIADECYKDGIQMFAIGHTLDDQVETYLLRKEKNSGNYGLAGISAVRSFNGLKIIRPLLALSREGLREYLYVNNIKWVDDPSNELDDFLRVRIRKTLKGSPQLKLDSIRELKRHGAARVEEDKKFCEFVKKWVSFSLYSAKIPIEGTREYGQDIFYLFMRKLIWIIGGAQYPCEIRSLKKGFKASIKFTIGRACVEFEKKGVIIYREQKNFETKKLGITTAWDNRFFIQSTFEKSNFYVSNLKKLDIINLRHIGKISKEYKIKFLCSLPGIYNEAGELKSVPAIGYKADGFMIKFTPPVEINDCFVSLM